MKYYEGIDFAMADVQLGSRNRKRNYPFYYGIQLVYAGEKLPEMYEQIIAEEVNVKAVENGAETWLDKELTAELREEGRVRDLIRAVQAARKKAGLQVDDRIRLSLSVKVPEQWRGVLMNEVLATELGQEGNYGYDEIAKVGGENVTISLEKVA